MPEAPNRTGRKPVPKKRGRPAVPPPAPDTYERMRRGLAEAEHEYGHFEVPESAFLDPAAADRVLVRVIHTGDLAEVRSLGVGSSREGEPLAYLVSAPIFGEICYLANLPGRGGRG